MNFDFLKQQETETPLFTDAKKVEEIKEKLCKKRFSLELEIESAEPLLRKEKDISLLELKKDMHAFGVSEIDYQIFLAKNNTGKL